MTNSPINTFQDILDALERDPALRETLRRHILSEEFLQMPAQVHALQADVEEIKVSIQRLDEGQQEIRADLAQVKDTVSNLSDTVSNLKDTVSNLSDTVSNLSDTVSNLSDTVSNLSDTVSNLGDTVSNLGGTVSSLGGTVSHLAGTDYESAAARYADRLARRNMNLENAVVVARAKGAGSTPPLPEGDQAAREGRIEWGEADDLAMADVIVAADTLDGEPVFVLAEISMTVQERDRSAAFRRADILERATGRTALPAVIGITEEAPETGPRVAFFPFDPEGAAVR